MKPTHPCPLPARHRRWPGSVRWFVTGAAFVLAATMVSAEGNSGVGRIKPDFAALAREALITLPPPPPWDPAHTATVWTIDDLAAEFAKVTDTPPHVNFLRSKLLRPEHAQLVEFKGWFHKAERPLKIRFVDQLWDCDNYAGCFVAFADLLALKAGETRGSICIGWATVFYRFGFAGVPAGGGHAVVIVGTSKGLFIIEPQDGTMVALRDYPNRHTIEEVYF
ncbi:MAG: hypothetical protein NTV51_21785 [Verrucomicrobia bacterium]|nr:hypothetical protein [Verrucomicrobiota bacterium]